VKERDGQGLHAPGGGGGEKCLGSSAGVGE
jgi:hypothetical protein